MNPADTTSGSQTRKRMSLVLLFALFLAPLLLAILLFYMFPDWRPTGTSNHGQLVEPVRELPPFQMETLSGEQIDETFLRGKWTLVYLLQGACDKPCVAQLYNIRQVRLAQGKNIDRLQRLLVWESGAISREDQVELQEHFPGQVIVPLTGQQAVVEVFSLDEQQPMAARRVYLVDPLGNLMMRYEPDDEPKGMIKDLERLLKYSGLG
ncbi:MAG: hypothetical protein WBM52_01960 [Thiogranum sp.]